MSIFTNRIISNAYMSMYKKKSPIMESYTYIYESAIDKNIHRADELADKIAKDVSGSLYGKEVRDAAGNIQTYARSGRAMLYNAEYIKHLVGEKMPFSKDKKSKAKFFLGATRIFGDILKNSHTEEDINRKCSEFNKIIGIIVNDSNHINEYDNNLNNLTLDKLKEKFGQKVKDFSDKEKEEISSKKYNKNERYKIIPCETREDMLQFGSPLTTWCVAQKEGGEHAYNSYTNNGMDKFYVCLRNDYKTVDKKPGDNKPLDDYGLSMIAICVNADGSLKTCTCRWNHDNGGNDNIMDAKQISDLLGVNFFDTFKPRDPKEIFAKLKYNESISLCSKLGVRFDKNNNCYRLKDNKIVKYEVCYNDYKKACLANKHFEWYDLETGKEIEPPDSIDVDFDCSYCNTLTSLEGSPSYVHGDFACSECINLTSLEGAPKKVDGKFFCYGCNNLTSLEGSPSIVNERFDCSYCDKLTSLKGAPNKVGFEFMCYNCKNLTSLEGSPSEVGGSFQCYGCSNLTSLKGAPDKVGKDFDCSNCDNLASLEGGPSKVGKTFDCTYCSNLTSLKGAPSEVGKYFYCYNCDKLTSIDEAPASIRVEAGNY